MNKKAYQKPAMQVVKINIRHQLLSGSPVNRTTNNVNMSYGGGGNGVSRSRDFDDWDDEE